MKARILLIAAVAALLIAPAFKNADLGPAVDRSLREVTAPSLWSLFSLHGQQSNQSNPPVPIQQVPTDLRACTPIHDSNASGVVNVQATITISPPSGFFVYLCGLDLQVVQNGTATANTLLKYTSTNFGGWAWEYSLAATANTYIAKSFYWNVPARAAQSGVAVTIVSPAATANTAFSANAYYYFAQF